MIWQEVETIASEASLESSLLGAVDKTGEGGQRVG